MSHNDQRFRGLLVSVCAALLLVSLPAAAQTPNPQSSGGFQAPSSPDFMLGRPRASLGVRGAWAMASAGSDIYDFVTKQLTLEKSSFNAPAFGAELGIVVASRLDVVAGFDFARSSAPSEYRAFVDNRNLPIEQTTSLKQANISGSLKFAVLPRGRAVGHFAWIPSTIVPYVGAGGGMTNYEFEQKGDFVDYADLSVFPESFRSSGWEPAVHVLGGADIQVYKSIFMSFEGRYTWADATMDTDFISFQPMDLGGFRFGAGFHVGF
jgi:opacity protein-like surface antigen